MGNIPCVDNGFVLFIKIDTITKCIHDLHKSIACPKKEM
jgi:hypothetical protein